MAQLDASIEYNQLAGLSMMTDQARALALYRKSLALRERLADSDPKDVLTRGRLGYVRDQVAELELWNRNLPAARQLAAKAIVDLEYVFAVTKSSGSAAELGSALETSAQIEHAAGRPAACSQARRAIELLAPRVKEPEQAESVARARAMVARCDQPARPD